MEPTYTTTALAGAVVATGAGVWWTVHGRQAVLAALVAAYVFLPAHRSAVLKAGGLFVAWLAFRTARDKGWF